MPWNRKRWVKIPSAVVYERKPMAYVVGIQARMSSTRLPGKVMMDLCGKPLIHRVWDACTNYWDRIVLTSKDPSDDVLCEYLEKHDMDFLRGSLEDVLSRYVEVANHFKPKCLVRVCADAPFIEEGWIRAAMKASPCFVPNVLHAGPWPEWRAADQRAEASDREHAGHEYFKRFRHLFLAPQDYLMVNTKKELEEARRRIKKNGPNKLKPRTIVFEKNPRGWKRKRGVSGSRDVRKSTGGLHWRTPCGGD